MEYSNRVSFKVSGKYALFSEPILRVGGEKCSYYVPTYQALVGIAEAIYWKPTIVWYIDRIRVMKPIQTQAKSVRTFGYNNKNDLSIYTYLYDVEYQVEAHFEWNALRQDLVNDRNEHKHFVIARRMIERGGKRDVFLGTRECVGYVEPCVFGEGKGAYDDIEEFDCGLMFHGFDYPEVTGVKRLGVRLSKIVMKKGIVDFERPENCAIRNDVRAYRFEHVMTEGDFAEDCEIAKESSL